jgi:hypothetical protein
VGPWLRPRTDRMRETAWGVDIIHRVVGSFWKCLIAPRAESRGHG